MTKSDADAELQPEMECAMVRGMKSLIPPSDLRIESKVSFLDPIMPLNRENFERLAAKMDAGDHYYLLDTDSGFVPLRFNYRGAFCPKQF